MAVRDGGAHPAVESHLDKKITELASTAHVMLICKAYLHLTSKNKHTVHVEVTRSVVHEWPLAAVAGLEGRILAPSHILSRLGNQHALCDILGWLLLDSHVIMHHDWHLSLKIR